MYIVSKFGVVRSPISEKQGLIFAPTPPKNLGMKMCWISKSAQRPRTKIISETGCKA